MGRDDHVIAPEERVLGERLLGKDIERGAGELARLQAALERLEINQRAPSAVDDPRAVAHLRNGVVVDHVLRLGRLRDVQRDHVGAGVQRVEGLHPLHPELAEALRGDELVERDDVHVECLCALGDELADAAEPNDTQRLAVKLVSAEP
jgi:hypothetical protein